MRSSDQENLGSPPPGLEGFAPRLGQAIAHVGLNQSEFARAVGASAGFVSDVVRGQKKPGAEFLSAVRTTFGISIDWLLTGEGTMMGNAGIDLDLLGSIRLQIAIARSAVLEGNPTARALLVLIRDARLQEAAAEPDIKAFLDTLLISDADIDLALQLYNGQLWTQDPKAQQRNLLAAAVAHFETRKPVDKMAALARSKGGVLSSLQINTGSYNKIAGRDFHER